MYTFLCKLMYLSCVESLPYMHTKRKKTVPYVICARSYYQYYYYCCYRDNEGAVHLLLECSYGSNSKSKDKSPLLLFALKDLLPKTWTVPLYKVMAFLSSLAHSAINLL